MRYSDAIALAVVLMTYWSPGAAVAQASTPNPPPAALATIQMSGRGFEEGLQDRDRFQVRLFIWSLEGAAQSILGPDVSLFEPGCVAQFGRGVQCAQLLVVGNAYILETFDTSSPDLVVHNAFRLAGEVWRVYFDPAPDGTRGFEDLASFEKGDPVAVYTVREFATADPVADVVWARNDQELLKSTPFTIRDVTIDFKNVAPRLMGLGHSRVPSPTQILNRFQPMSRHLSPKARDSSSSILRSPGRFRRFSRSKVASASRAVWQIATRFLAPPDQGRLPTGQAL